MELSEAFRIIDATLGMFRSFADEIDNRDPEENFLATPVRSHVQTVLDENLNPEIQHQLYYTYNDGYEKYNMNLVDVRPVCSFLINEWPSTKTKKIREQLYKVYLECWTLCKEPLDGMIDMATDDGYSYDSFYTRSQDTRNIATFMLDTIHEMSHALGLTTSTGQDDVKAKNAVVDNQTYISTSGIKKKGNIWSIHRDKKISQYQAARDSLDFFQRILDEGLDELPAPIIKIAHRKQTALLVALDVMYNAGWFAAVDEGKRLDRNSTLQYILRRAFGIESANVQQLLSTPKTRQMEGENWRQKYFNELQDAFENYEENRETLKKKRKNFSSD